MSNTDLLEACREVVKWLDSTQVKSSFRRIDSLALTHPHLAVEISPEFSEWAGSTLAAFRRCVEEASAAQADGYSKLQRYDPDDQGKMIDVQGGRFIFVNQHLEIVECLRQENCNLEESNKVVLGQLRYAAKSNEENCNRAAKAEAALAKEREARSFDVAKWGLAAGDLATLQEQIKTAAKVEAASASADWIPYYGSGMPVDRAAIIDAKLRSGQIVIGRRADHFAWGLIFTSTDIIAYRIAKPVTQASAEDDTPETDGIMKCLRLMLNERGERREALKGAVECGIESVERDRNCLQRQNAELCENNRICLATLKSKAAQLDNCEGALADAYAENSNLKSSFRLPPLNEAVKDILGRMCFTLVDIANILRASGAEIKPKAEDEQAHAIYFLLTKYVEHGDQWAGAANSELRKMLETARAIKMSAEDGQACS